MAWPLIALAAGSALAGGLGGKSKAKAANKPTVTTIKKSPVAALGGYQRILDALNAARNAPGYQVGANNPYLNPVMSHLMERAGIGMPEGGWMPPPRPPGYGVGVPMGGDQGTPSMAGMPQFNPYLKDQPAP